MLRWLLHTRKQTNNYMSVVTRQHPRFRDLSSTPLSQIYIAE